MLKRREFGRNGVTVVMELLCYPRVHSLLRRFFSHQSPNFRIVRNLRGLFVLLFCVDTIMLRRSSWFLTPSFHFPLTSHLWLFVAFRSFFLFLPFAV